MSNLSNGILKNALQILFEHCPQAHRKSSATKKDLIDWLQCSNPKRDYIFFSSAGLKALMNTKGISLSGRVNMDRMRDV